MASEGLAEERDILFIKVTFSQKTFANEEKVSKSSEKVHIKTKMAEN